MITTSGFLAAIELHQVRFQRAHQIPIWFRGPSVTYIVSGGALNSTHSLAGLLQKRKGSRGTAPLRKFPDPPLVCMHVEFSGPVKFS